MARSGRLLSLNVARASAVTIRDRSVMTAIGKRAVEGARAVATLGIEGDEQADLTVHGGPSKAVYAYPSEHYPFWQTVRAQAGVAPWDEPLVPGSRTEKYQPHQALCTISLAACAKPIAALNLKHGKRGPLTASAQFGKRSTSPMKTSLSTTPASVRFSPSAPGESVASHGATPAWARTVCQNG